MAKKYEYCHKLISRILPFCNQTSSIHINTYIYIYGIYKLLIGGWFWGPRAMIGETMMKFSGSRTIRVSAIGIFLRNLPEMEKRTAQNGRGGRSKNENFGLIQNSTKFCIHNQWSLKIIVVKMQKLTSQNGGGGCCRVKK